MDDPRALPYSKQLEIRQAAVANPGISNSELGKLCGVGKTSALKYRGSEPKKPSEPKVLTEASEIDGSNWNIALPKTRISTLEELVAHCKIDLEIWEIARWSCRKWEMGAKEETSTGEGREKKTNSKLVIEPMFAVSASLKKRTWVEEANRIIERLRKKAEKHAPVYPHLKTIPSKSGNVVEISPVDVHHGALIWGKETGSADWDLKKSERAYKDAVSELMLRTDAFKPEKAVLVLGHDQQNADNRAGMTEAGTPQSNDGRYQKVFDVSCDCSIWAIDTCLLKYGEVEVFMIPGNHDPVSTWTMGKVLQAWYRNSPKVTIRNSPNPRQYWEYGVNMLLLTHGNRGKLENYDKVMAAEQPAMWGRTKWREAHTGDKHHRRMIETQGATVRILPSLRPPCSWSAENHFIGAIRAAEAYVWSKTEGLVGTACYSILEEAK